MTRWTEEQTSAIYKKGTNIIVSAGAGSGKTAVLTERVLQKVKNGISISNLLILTFTKMAAKEMKERIYKKLVDNNLTKESNLVDTADITTFDAYSLALVKKYHYYLNLSKNISIIDSSVISLYKKDKLKEIFDNLYEKEDPDFLNLIKEYSLKDDKEIFDYIMSLNDKLDLKPNKKEYLDNYIDLNFNKDKIIKDINIFTKELKDKIDLIREYLDYISDDNLREKLISAFKLLFESNTYDEIKENLPEKMPIVRNISEDDKNYKEKISNLLKEIKKYTSYNSEQEIFDGIIKTKPFVEEIITLVKLLDSKVSLYKQKYNSFEYSDISLFAIKLVKENDLIREEIKGNLNEILIDEYQDTNDIQEEFISLIQNNNVYMVGDIKQSIYRFRNANPYIFMNKYNNYSNNVGGIKIDLNKNFRSREEVINNINMMFDKIMTPSFGGASYKESHRMIYGNMIFKNEGDNHQNNNLDIITYDEDKIYSKAEIEAFAIAKDIINKVNNGYLAFDKDTNLNRKIKYSDFVVLMDNSKYFELYKKIFEYLSIPTTIMKSGNLLDGNIVIIIKNIISFILKVKENLIDKEFKRLFISLSRSFLFNLDDEIIFDYFLNNNYIDSQLYKISKDISEKIDTLNLIDIIDLIIKEFDIYNKLILVGDYKVNILRMDALKDIINNLTNLDYNIVSLNDYLAKIIENNVKIEFNINEFNEDSVKIMTIHASKGLEFNYCYFSSLYNRFNIREAINKFTYDTKYGIIIPYKNDFIYNTIYHDLSYILYLKENIGERIRLLYVALTRSKEKMIFLLPKKETDIEDTFLLDDFIKSKYNSFASIIYSLGPDINNYVKEINTSSLNLSKDYNLIKNEKYKDMINKSLEKINVSNASPIYNEETSLSFSKNEVALINSDTYEYLKYGISAHELFELTDFQNVNYNLLNEKETKIIDNFLKKVDIKDSKIYKEYEFIYEEDGITYHGIIDLMLVYQDNIKIIDYKLKHIDDLAYVKQLNGYKDYISKKFQKDVKIYLYSILDNILKEII